MHCLFRSTYTTALLVLASSVVFSQAPSPPPASLWVEPAPLGQDAPSLRSASKPLAKGPYRIAGRLLDAQDGHGLSHAAVTLYDSDAGSRLLETQTNASGAFAVPDLPAGKYRIEGAARGYITASYDEHEEFSTAIVTGAGFDTESLKLKLQPAARVSGRVTDEAGDPVRNATVTLFRESTESGFRRTTTFRNARVDDLGRFELTRLPAGTYYATVRAVPWYATHAPVDEAKGNGFGIAASVDPALDVSYPLVFYPEATDATGASPILLKPGDRFLADFRLTPQPAQRLLIHMPEPQGGPPRINIPQLQQKVFDSTEPVAQQGVRILGPIVEISGLPAGRYQLREGSQNGLGPAREVDLTGGALRLESGSLPSFGAVTVRLAETSADQAGSRAKPPQNLQLALHRVAAEDSGSFGPEKFGRMKDGMVEIQNVEPGDYRIEPAGSRLHVASVTENGKTSPGALLHVTGEGQSVTITLGSGSVDMTGYARHEGKGESGDLVVLVPAGGDHSADLYRRDQSDLDGSFHFSNVMPGNYLLIAIRDGWGLEWGKPEALAAYLLKAVPVTVPPDGHGVMKLSEGVTVQPR